MKRVLRLLFLLPAFAVPAAATTYQMVSDQVLVDQAAAVAEVRVVAAEPAPTTGRPATDYTVEVERLVKGHIPGSTIVVRVPGGVRPDGVGLKVWGAPEFGRNESALLFLRPADDGTYRILHMMLGAFHRRQAGGRDVVVRDLSDTFEVGPAGLEAKRDMVRDLVQFREWVADRAEGVRRERDYVLDSEAQELEQAVEPFSYMETDAGTPIRWFRFDSGQSVPWKVHVSGQSGLGQERSIQAFKTAMNAWVADAGSNVFYTYAGVTSSGAGLDHDDGTNAILFDDPRGNEAEGTFSCSDGGVIAVGGPFFYTTTRNWGGKKWHEAAEADIVTNDGTECFFQNNPKAAEEVFAHELGHTLGLGHSTSRDALMFARAHDDGRGARVTSDDLAGIASLYPSGSGSGGGNPGTVAAPGNLTAQAASSTEISLAWKDNSSDETGFRVESKVAGGTFKEVLSLPAGTTTAKVGSLKESTEYVFRVRASGASGFSAYTATARATTRGGATPAATPPNFGGAPSCGSGDSTLCLHANRFRVRVLWRNSATEAWTAGHLVKRTDQSGTVWFFGAENVEQIVKVLDGRGVNGKFWVFAGALTDREYWLEVTDSATGAVRLYHNRAGDTRGFADTGFPGSAASQADVKEIAQISQKTPPVMETLTVSTGVCVADARTLCLMGRYEVEVTWKTATQAGVGTAVPDSGNTGFFWFFGPENLELVVKVLDGTGINGKAWVFYGSLSDVEYTVRVTDTQTGKVKTYRNQQGNLSGVADTSAL